MISIEALQQIIKYNPETGCFTWLVSSRRVPAGSMAGHVSRYNGKAYVKIGIDGREYYAHRLAFLYMTGRWPENDVDHRDTDGTNNRWQNLRQATKSQNGANRGAQSNNTTGFKGVYHKGHRFGATITVNQRQIHLGYFDTPEEAHAAYVTAAKDHFGEFSNTGQEPHA